MKVHKLRISFTGIASNALRDLARLEYLAKESDNFRDPNDDENLAYSVKSCISAYHDTLLALARGETTVEEVTDFWFLGADPARIRYDGSVVIFSEKEPVI